MDTVKEKLNKGKINRLPMNPSPDLIKRWYNEIDIEMQLVYDCPKFTKGIMKQENTIATIEEIADMFSLNAISDLKDIKALRQEMMKDILIKKPQLKQSYDQRMIATIKNAVTSDVLNNVEQSPGYDETLVLNNSYKLYLFIVDVVIHKTNSRNPIQVMTELSTNIYTIKQGPNESINDYNFRATSILEIFDRALMRQNKFYLENDINDTCNTLGLNVFLYIILRGLNDNHSTFKIDVNNRMMINKGIFPYNSIPDLLNAANDYCATSNNKGKSFLSFSSNYNNLNCTYCNKAGHIENTCYAKYPEKYTPRNKKSYNKYKSNTIDSKDIEKVSIDMKYKRDDPRQDQPST
jgi:hypothetical protein